MRPKKPNCRGRRSIIDVRQGVVHLLDDAGVEILLRGGIKPKLAVYAHIVTCGRKDDDIMQRVKAGYDGDVRLGRDLMAIGVAKDGGGGTGVNGPRAWWHGLPLRLLGL